ncbi:hypothetical protein IMZ31_05415 [Pontibacillus sp. ALD_SL1]|uniref:hypothetical protein n=1 Tax=Pontibacillus sp. ALD_SL1 TaxID=2777185 RepID=UPI001A9781D7|nr:hypothetical protein [Pontibacillus sp. ALD_SL1]QST01010.1 hypothetical protein IMZ31_05415 [Pontibacillus sp. ALD_SL1]
MNKRILLVLFVLFVTTACSGEFGELTRVDVQHVTPGEDNAGVDMITDADSIQTIRDVMKEIQWEDKNASMVRKADVRAVYYYEQEEDMPERLVEYDIWFTDKPVFAVIMSEEEGRRYGVVRPEQGAILRDMFVK